MENLSRIARKITFILFLEQSLASAGIIAVMTLNSIVGAKLSQHAGWAGVPTAVYLLSGAFSAFLWGHLMEVIGRRGGLTMGLGLGVLGSGLAFLAVSNSQFTLFLAGMVLMGAANSAVQLGRFAAAEVHPPAARGRAISNVVIGGTFGAVLGPNLVGPVGAWIKPFSGDELAGAYAAGMVLFLIGMITIFIGLRPDPREVGRELSNRYPETSSDAYETRRLTQVLWQPGAITAVVSMVFGQMVMVLVMVITSLHMRDHHHGLGDISIVISSHTFGMYAFSILSGRLSDRFGRGPVIFTGALTLIIACLAATISPDVLPLGVALFLLGLGWNFCFVAGSTLFADQLSQKERSRLQGFNDLLVGMSSAIGSLSSGLIFAAVGYNTMAYISAALAFIPLTAVVLWMQGKPRELPVSV